MLSGRVVFEGVLSEDHAGHPRYAVDHVFRGVTRVSDEANDRLLLGRLGFDFGLEDDAEEEADTRSFHAGGDDTFAGAILEALFVFAAPMHLESGAQESVTDVVREHDPSCHQAHHSEHFLPPFPCFATSLWR